MSEFAQLTKDLPFEDGVIAAKLAMNFTRVLEGEIESADLLQRDAESGNSTAVYVAARSVINDYLGGSKGHLVPQVNSNIALSETDLEALNISNPDGQPVVVPTESTKEITFSNIESKKSFRLLDTIFRLDQRNPETGEVHGGHGRILRLTSEENSNE